MSDESRNVPGTILRGPDGKVYFIPDTALPSLMHFRVFDNQVARIERLLEDTALGAMMAEESEPFTEHYEAQADEQLEPPHNDVVNHDVPLKAVHVTLEIRPEPAGSFLPKAVVAMVVKHDE